MRKLILFSAAVLAALGTSSVQAQLFQGPFGPGGTWNLYEAVDIGATWLDAHQDATSNIQMGVTGHLPDIISREENNALWSYFGGDNWIGLTDREGMAPEVMNGGLPAPQEANTLPDPLTQGWAWTSGAAFNFQNWGGGEPNDSGGEDVAHIRGDGLWNDHKSGLFEDEPIAPVLQPGTSTDESGGPSFPYFIEYPTQAADMLAGIDLFPEPPKVMPDVLPGIDGGAGFVGVTDFFTGGTVTEPATAVSQMLTDIVNGDLEPEVFAGDETYTKTDITDPATNPNGGTAVSGVPLDYPGGGGDDFITVVKGAFRVTEPGTYTVRVQSDDGFAIRVNGTPFDAVQGNGTQDTDPEVMYHSANTGNSDTRGVLNLAAGVHTFEGYTWERGGGAFTEISTAKGDFRSGGGASWLAIGDETTIPDRTVGAIAKLTGPMFVGNLNNVDSSAGILEAAREDLLDTIDDLDAVDDTITQFVIDDHNTALGCPFNEIPTFHDAATVAQWPNTAGNLDNFSSIVLGSFTLDDGDGVAGETMEVSVHMDSDDQGSFRIIGQSFDDVTGGDMLELEGDNSIYAARNVCNTNVTGVITLTEGETYDFEAIHVEAGGDAGMQILFAPGNHIDSFDAGAFFALSTSADPVFIPGNTGLPLVDPNDVGTRGDYNGNGSLDAGDLDLQSQAMKDQDLAFDENNDGVVDGVDRKLWVNDLKNTWMGDADLNGQFNSSDFVIVFTAGLYETGTMAGWAQGDWDGDMDFDSSDFVAAFGDGGYEMGEQPGGPNPATAAVPEPSSIVLALISLIGLMGVARRRNG